MRVFQSTNNNDEFSLAMEMTDTWSWKEFLQQDKKKHENSYRCWRRKPCILACKNYQLEMHLLKHVKTMSRAGDALSAHCGDRTLLPNVPLTLFGETQIMLDKSYSQSEADNQSHFLETLLRFLWEWIYGNNKVIELQPCGDHRQMSISAVVHMWVTLGKDIA